ncbi:hypothetical protein [Vibrio nigripulchritudo]|uniref:hypothetical protein n=1 Tax=Vibrio nigripulchritudo TaxID=28173 RepID=UPI0005F9B9D7|nr:hypothetical protein [Vibrio nigripulchritudo]KJY77268.1 hypothetical protein TW74_13255 [Vibrio nigripulchritudo]
MKTTAYVIDKKTGKYKLDDKGNHLWIGINDALNLRDDPKRYRKQIHESRIYMTRNPNPKKRVVLIPKSGKSPHYAFAKGITTTGDRSYDETFSHEAAVDALSKITRMAISANGCTYHFQFTQVFREPALKLPNGRVFYPDILCLFDKGRHPKEYAMWGGKLAIEVTNTHECEDDKLLEFELCNIPVFEFKINESRKYPPERDSGREDTISERLHHENRLNRWLQDEVWMDHIINPVSTSHHEKKCKMFTQEISVLQNREQELNQSIELLVAKQHQLKKLNQSYIDRTDQLSHEVSELSLHLEDNKKMIAKQKNSLAEWMKAFSRKNSEANFWFSISLFLMLLVPIAYFSNELTWVFNKLIDSLV